MSPHATTHLLGLKSVKLYKSTEAVFLNTIIAQLDFNVNKNRGNSV